MTTTTMTAPHLEIQTATILRIIRADDGRGSRKATASRILCGIRAEIPDITPAQIAAILIDLGCADYVEAEPPPPLFVRMVKPQFEEPILAGIKTHTIRPPAFRPWVIGADLSLRVWTGKPYREPQREILLTTLKAVEPITLGLIGVRYRGKFWAAAARTQRPYLEALAKRDGFADWIEMKQWFCQNHRSFAAGNPFHGELIHWEPPAKPDTSWNITD